MSGGPGDGTVSAHPYELQAFADKVREQLGIAGGTLDDARVRLRQLMEGESPAAKDYIEFAAFRRQVEKTLGVGGSEEEVLEALRSDVENAAKWSELSAPKVECGDEESLLHITLLALHNVTHVALELSERAKGEG